MQNRYEILREQTLNFGHDTYPPADYGFSPFNEQRFIQTSVIEFRQCCSFTQTVEDSCHNFKSQFSIIRRIGNQSSESGLGNSSKSSMSEKNTKEMTEKLLEDLIKVATYLILAVAKVGKYAYGLVSFVSLRERSQGLIMLSTYRVEIKSCIAFFAGASSPPGKTFWQFLSLFDRRYYKPIDQNTTWPSTVVSGPKSGIR
jgi:hypothetical protein